MMQEWEFTKDGPYIEQEFGCSGAVRAMARIQFRNKRGLRFRFGLVDREGQVLCTEDFDAPDNKPFDVWLSATLEDGRVATGFYFEMLDDRRGRRTIRIHHVGMECAR